MSVVRTNLLELASRPGRFEHHLTVVARVGDAQLEIATASEPLYFAHVNVSDEYAMALPTGDPPVEPTSGRQMIPCSSARSKVSWASARAPVAQ